MNILILGGTSEANLIAESLAGEARFVVTLSLAGRTVSPRLPPVATRTGGFGGFEGLAAYLRAGRIAAVIDATHPFATRISANAAAATKLAGIPLIALERPAWTPVAGDRWTLVANIEAAAAALPDRAECVLLTVGRQSLAPFAAKPQHHYVIRVIDPPDIPPQLRDVEIVTGRGPFQRDDEIVTMREHRIDRLVSKNSGGEGSYAKLAVARALGLPVILVQRPLRTGDSSVQTTEQVLHALNLLHADLAKRSV